MAAGSGQNTSIVVTEDVLKRRTYFSSVMVAYIAGLGVAFAANAITHLGQPGARQRLISTTSGGYRP